MSASHATRIGNELTAILDRLIQGYRPNRVILFGSWAWGLPHHDSDFDLLIIKETQDRFIDRCSKTRKMISDPSCTEPLDLIVMTPSEVAGRLEQGDPFIKMILRQGKVLYDCAAVIPSLDQRLRDINNALEGRIRNAKTVAHIQPVLEDIMDKLVPTYAPDKVVLFGSWANGYAQEDSDIDLLIIKDTSERYLERCRQVRRIITDPKRTIPVDVFVLTPEELEARSKRPDSFLKEAFEKGRILYAA